MRSGGPSERNACAHRPLAHPRASTKSLDVTDLRTVVDPLATLDAWMDEARRAGIETWNAVTLATVDERGFPDARIVLLKERRGREMHFFTNYESRKAEQLARTPRAALVYHFAAREWQARLRGEVRRLSRAESEAYFATRPRESRIGAWASTQSRPLRDREELESRRREFEEKFAGGDVPCPPFWGGFGLMVEECELWVGHVGRLHDRALFRFDGEASDKSYLYP